MLTVPAVSAVAGQIEDWTKEMNQTSYWEDRLGLKCNKYHNHNGFIPARHDVAIIKAGAYVAIYDPAPDDEIAPAPYGKDPSWVMKCRKVETTTTTTEAETTTTLFETTTTTVATTTTAPTTTTTAPTTTTTTVATTTTAPETTTTTVKTTTTEAPPPTLPTPIDPPELPYTGPVDTHLVPYGAALLGVGATLLFVSRRFEEVGVD